MRIDEYVPSVPPPLFACLRSPARPKTAIDVAKEFSPRIQRYGNGCVVLDISGLGSLLGEPQAIGAELWRALRDPRRSASRDQLDPFGSVSREDQLDPFGSAFREDQLDPFGSASRENPLRSASRDRDQLDLRCGIAATQVGALMLSRAHPVLTVATSDVASALAPLPLWILQQSFAEIRSAMRSTRSARATSADCFDVLRRWGLTTIGEYAALPAGELSARLGQEGIALQQLARGIDPRPLVPDPDVPRFLERLELEWPIEELEPLSFVLARLLDPLSSSLERADRGAVAIRLDLRLVDRTTHTRLLPLPVAMRDPRVLRTLILLALESHPPPAAVDIVTIELDPAPGRVISYSLLERPLPSAETLATLTARLGALVGDSRCGAPVLLDSHGPDAFEMRRLQGGEGKSALRQSAMPIRNTLGNVVRRFRPPIAVRVSVDRGRPVRVAIDRRGMPGGRVEQSAGPWRSSGAWWRRPARHWDRDEWEIALSDGSVCLVFRSRDTGRWFLDGVFD
jgi:hypothetical protein